MSDTVNMNNEYDTLFRSAYFGGFNKEDVLDYIERMVRSRKKDNEKYLDNLKQLEQERRELSEKLDAVKSAIDEKDRLLTEWEDTCEKLKLENHALADYNTTMKEELVSANDTIVNLKSGAESFEQTAKTCAELSEQVASLKAESAQDKTLISQLRNELLNLGNEANTSVKAEGDYIQKLNAAEARILELEEELAVANVQVTIPQSTSGQTTADKIIISTLETRNADLSARIADLEAKLRKYESDKVRIRTAEDSAYAKAKRIELDAYAKANALRAEANERISTFAKRLSALSDALLKARNACVSESEKTSAAYDLLLDETNKLRQSLETNKE